MGGNAGKLAIAAVLFVVAGVLFVKLRDSGGSPKLADDAKKLDYLCTDCGHHFQLTQEEKEAAVDAAAAPPPPPEETERTTRSRLRLPTAIACLECGENAALVASRCQKHNEFYPKRNQDGTRGACPKCP